MCFRFSLVVLLTLTDAAHYVPKWEPIWQMNLSTIVMPCNDSGYYDPRAVVGYGIVDFDWSNAKQLWCNTKPMNCQARLIDQAQMVHKASPDTKVWVYRNLVKALPWYSEVREKLTDPQYSGWFLKFKPNGPYHVPQCTASKCTDFYHDQEQTPRHPHGDGSCIEECDCGSVPCGEYLWDHRNSSVRRFLVNTFIGGSKYGLGNPFVQGFYLDDGWSNHPDPRPSWAPPQYKQCDMAKTGGATEENYYCTEDMGLSHQDVIDIYNGWKTTINEVHEYIVAHEGFAWQLFTGPSGLGSKLADRKANCAKFLQNECTPGHNNSFSQAALMYQWTGTSPGHANKLTAPEQDTAMFMLVRGAYAWLGYAWSGCGNPFERPAVVEGDYGKPVEAQCSETSPNSGVFKREWSKVTVEMDCNTWTASFKLK